MTTINLVEAENSEIKPTAEAINSPLVTLPQWPFSWPSLSAMRAYVQRAKELGLSDAFVRVGRRVLVDPQKFFSLIRHVKKLPSKVERLNQNHTKVIPVRPKGNKARKGECRNV
jgi:hypothetical protein